MKISKIRHTKAAVKGGEKGGGFLYRNPIINNNKDKSINLKEHIEKQIQAADGLAKGKIANSKKPQFKKNKEKLIAAADEWFRKKVSVEKHTRKGIENQNLVIQPMVTGSADSQEVVLAPARVSNAKEEKQIKKQERKDAFRNFFFDYAVLDEEKRKDMLRRLRRLVLLYFYGEDELKDKLDADFDVWDNHNQKKGCDDYFVKYEFKSENANSKKNEADNSGKEESKIELKDVVRTENIKRYRNSVAFMKSELESGNTNKLFFDDEALNIFWIEHIESAVERIFKHDKRINNDFKLKVGYLSEKVWKDIINYMSIKYVAVGKTVYHTAMSNINTFDNNGVMKLGVVDERYVDGISSFEFESIKAEESFQRELAMYISFAARHLADAAIERGEGREDILVLSSREEIDNVLKDNADRNVLRFFGGRSRWIDNENNIDCFKTLKSKNIGRDIVNETAKVLFSLRNENFHYADSVADDKKEDYKTLELMFEKDVEEYGKVMKDKFYSNNVPMFYEKSDIEKLLDSLYNSYSERASQVPAFNNVVKRNELNEFLSEKRYHINTTFSDDVLKNWQKAIYYVLKEIYYNSFICSEEAKNLFLQSLDNPGGKHDNDPDFNKEAVSDFNQRIGRYNIKIKRFDGGITGYSLSEICQIIMTEYNQQNNNSRRKKSAKVKNRIKDSYPHYRRLLYKAIQIAFVKYLENHKDLYGFLGSPEYKDNNSEQLSAEKFLQDYKCERFDNLVNEVKKDKKLLSWYVLGMMLTPKQLNQLSGSVKNYIGYKKDVLRRASDTGNPLAEDFTRAEELGKALKILDMCTQLSGRTTNNCTDYFDDEDDFARYVAKFFKFDDLSVEHKVSISTALKDCCEKEEIGIFYDGSNPILNRNVVLSKMYGSGEVLAKILEDSEVTLKDVKELLEMEKDPDIINYKKCGVCSSEKEIESIKNYQDLKNHVEFRDLVDYSEIIDELLGQLVKWSYLRERDLMYFQLGFHYACLHNDSEKLEDYKAIAFEDKKIEGAILYQIVAMNTFGMPLYYKNKDKYIASMSDSQYSTKLMKAFIPYSKNMYENNRFLLYSAGLELFEVLNEHEAIIKLRNDIEHFHYYYNVIKEKTDKNTGEECDNHSLLDIYGEVFDRFFTYDIKYHKNVPNVLYNILLSHLVNVRFDYVTGKKDMDDGSKKDCAALKIKEIYGICSELFQYRYKDNNEEKITMLPARSERYILNVAKLLNYPKKDAKVGFYKDFMKITDKKNSSGNRNNKGKANNNSNNNNKKNNNNNKSNNNKYNKNKYNKNNLKE